MPSLKVGKCLLENALLLKASLACGAVNQMGAFKIGGNLTGHNRSNSMGGDVRILDGRHGAHFFMTLATRQ